MYQRSLSASKRMCVSDRPVGAGLGVPLFGEVVPLHGRGKPVSGSPAGCVGQMSKRGRQADSHRVLGVAVRRHPDRLIAEWFSRLAVCGDEHPFGVPLVAPLLQGDTCGLQVVALASQACATQDYGETALRQALSRCRTTE